MSDILVIMSGSYCNPELQNEFGKIPSALVPIGHRRLLDHQLELNSQSTLLVVPNDYYVQGSTYQVDPKARIDQAFHEIARKLVNLQLPSDHTIHFLWGDTLIKRLSDTECVGVSFTNSEFAWEYVNGFVFNGYLAIKPSTLKAAVKSGSRTLQKLIASLPLKIMGQNDWMDFGHATTYWKSRTHFFKTRHFNSLRIAGDRLVKTSSEERTNCEFNWYTTIPNELKQYSPQVHRISSNQYSMNFIPNPSLSELWVYGKKTNSWWESVLSKVFDFIDLGASHRGYNKDPMFLDKTRDRLSESPWRTLHSRSAIKTLKPLDKVVVIHGDLCFSNILYDSRTDTISVIDPRGQDSDGNPSIYGHSLYDVAKLAHSLIGGYDLIVAGLHYRSTSYSMREWFYGEAFYRFGYTRRQINAAMGLLFVSMVPLHMDDMVRARRLHERGVAILRNA